MSIVNNIAEGAGEFSSDEKCRFYRMSKRSGTESAAILDGCRAMKLGDQELVKEGRALLISIVSQLTTMLRNRA